MTIEVRPANAGALGDIETVMGANGGAGGCWCTFWRLTNQESAGRTSAQNLAMMQQIVRERDHAGLIAHVDGEPVGWCSLAPRDDYARVFRTNGIQPDDATEPNVWSIVCVLVRKSHRGQGIAEAMVEAAVAHAGAHGASVVEGYPLMDKDQGRKSGLSSGAIGLFTRASFTIHTLPDVGRRADLAAYRAEFGKLRRSRCGGRRGGCAGCDRDQ